MLRKGVWLVVCCLIVAIMVLSSCQSAAVQKEEGVTVVGKVTEKPTTKVEEEEVEGVAEQGEEMITIQLTKKDGTPVTKTVEKPRYGGVLNICLGYPPVAFDSTYTYDYDCFANALVLENLACADWAMGPAGTGETTYRLSLPPILVGTATGMLAESWEIEGNDTMIFHIRKGVNFALDTRNEASRLVGGREIDAYDLEWSRKYYFETPRGYLYSSYGPHYVSTTAIDKWTLEVKVKPGYVGLLFDYAADYSGHVAREVVEKYGDVNDWSRVVGTGPYMLVDYVEGSSMTFEKNPNYWRKHPVFHEDTMPYLDGIKDIIITDPSTRLAALRTGKIDVQGGAQHCAITWEEAESLWKTNPELLYGENKATSNWGMFMKLDKAPFDDINVRHALSMAVDRQEIIETIYGGNSSLEIYPVASFFPDYYLPFDEYPESVMELYEYNSEKAKQLLIEAGYPEGFKASVVADARWEDLLLVVQQQWTKIGVDLELDMREPGTYHGIRDSHEFQDMLISNLRLYGPHKFMEMTAGSPLNISEIDDSRIQELHEGINANIFDRAAVSSLFKELQPYVSENAWFIQLPAQSSYTFWQPWVKEYHGEGGIGYSESSSWAHYVWIDEDMKYEMTK